MIRTVLLIGTFGCLLILIVARDLSPFSTLPMLMWATTVTIIASRVKKERGAERPAGGTISKALAATAIIASLISLFMLTYFSYFSGIYILHGPF